MRRRYSWPCFAIVIVHGQTEKLFVQAVRQVCHSHIKIISRASGHSSIQIDHLGNFINSNQYLKDPKCVDEYCKFPTKKENKYINEKRWKDFHIYALMDVDDIHGKDIKYNYLQGHVSGISNRIISKHTVGIYNNPNFEPVMKYGCHIKDISYNKKSYDHYNSLFASEIRSIPDVQQLREDLKNYPKTNMDKLLDDCLDSNHIPSFG